MKLDEIQNVFSELVLKRIISKYLSGERINVSEAIPEEVQKLLDPLSDEISVVIYKALHQSMRSMLQNHRHILKRFEKNHYILWKKGIDLLESFLVVTFEIGESIRANYNDSVNKQDYLFEALTRLHARSVHIGREVLCLLYSGFSDGAHARWRTAHEIAVVANFLSEHGNEVAKKYIEHEAIESYRAMYEFQKHAESLGQDKFSTDEVNNIERIRNELIKKYGDSYDNQYGWAAETLKNRKPSFYDIEKASGLGHWRPYYRMASHNIHANPKGALFRLGLSSDANTLLAGPSNYGLADPAQDITISILQVTIPLLNMTKNIDSIIMGKILMLFVDDIKLAFMNINTKISGQNATQQISPTDTSISRT